MGIKGIPLYIILIFMMFITQTVTIKYANAQQITMNGVARSWSLFMLIAETCPRYAAVSAGTAHKFAAVFYDTGLSSYGSKSFKTEASKELKRRRREVNITGPQQWCLYQRSHLQQMGNYDVFIN